MVEAAVNLTDGHPVAPDGLDQGLQSAQRCFAPLRNASCPPEIIQAEAVVGQGTYGVQLLVRDERGASSEPITAIVVVPNIPVEPMP